MHVMQNGAGLPLRELRTENEMLDLERAKTLTRRQLRQG